MQLLTNQSLKAQAHREFLTLKGYLCKYTKTFILFLLAPNLILASGRYPSPLPTPTTEILRLQ